MIAVVSCSMFIYNIAAIDFRGNCNSSSGFSCSAVLAISHTSTQKEPDR